MNSPWNCSICPYVSSRKWNLVRHYEKVHGQILNPPHKGLHQNFRVIEKKPTVNGNLNNTTSPHIDPWQSVIEFSKMHNTIANSNRTFDRLNYFETKANTLENQLRDLYRHNWIIPRFHVRGLNGHICNFCNTFSYKLVMDLGFDLTMQYKHNCTNQTGGFTIPIPKEVNDIDGWAASVLFGQMSYYESIGNCIALDNLTNVFDVYRENGYRDLILGIPERHPLITIDKNFMKDWIDMATKTPVKRILMRDSQILDLLRKTKSTYGILEVPQQEGFKYYYMKIVR